MIQYQLFHHLTPERPDHFTEDQPLWADPTVYNLGNVDVPAPWMLNVIELIQAMHASRLRPDAEVAPPLGVGDMIAVMTINHGYRYYSAIERAVMFAPENVVEADTYDEAYATVNG
jgi:hypothetical protein